MTDLWTPLGVAGDSLLQLSPLTKRHEHQLAPVDLAGSRVASTNAIQVRHLIVEGSSVGHVDFGQHLSYKDPAPIGEFFGAPLSARLSREGVKRLELCAHGVEWSVVREGKSMVLRRADSRVASLRKGRVPAKQKSDFEYQADLSWTPAAAPVDLMLYALIYAAHLTGPLDPPRTVALGLSVSVGKVVAEEAREVRDMLRDIRPSRRDRNREE